MTNEDKPFKSQSPKTHDESEEYDLEFYAEEIGITGYNGTWWGVFRRLEDGDSVLVATITNHDFHNPRVMAEFFAFSLNTGKIFVTFSRLALSR